MTADDRHSAIRAALVDAGVDIAQADEIARGLTQSPDPQTRTAHEGVSVNGQHPARTAGRPAIDRAALAAAISDAEAVGDITTSMRLKGQLHQENQRNTGRDGYVTMPTRAETEAESLRRQLDQALEHGDTRGASVFAGALAAPGVHGDGNPGPAASVTAADQGSRTPPPAVPPLEQALAKAERDGDWDEHGRLNLIKLAQYAKDHPHA